jgi:hypothetical protein
MNVHHFKIYPVFGKIKENGKTSKIQILVHQALWCELVGGKNHKLAIPQVSKKKLHKIPI